MLRKWLQRSMPLLLGMAWALVPLSLPLRAAPLADAALADGTDPPKPTEAASLPVENEEPFSAWRTHVASRPEEAIVLVRYSGADAEGKANTATGIVIRCDGFVLVPKAVHDAVLHRGKVEVVVARAEGASLTGPKAVPARAHPGKYSSVGYGLVKINGYHIPCCPLLSASSIEAGTRVRVVWAEPDADGYSVRTRGAVVTTQGGDRFGAFALAADGKDVLDIPAGSVVIDEQSGAALGMATSGGTSSAFQSFARFHVIANEVGIAPSRDAVRMGQGDGGPSGGGPGMVWVPGGPVRLGSDSQFARYYGTDVVCTPGFWADRDPVTNQEYRHWLTGKTRRNLPAGWGPMEVQAPTRRDDLPVTGMTAQDAERFAESRSARLMTEVEWMRASYVSSLGWATEMDSKWNYAARLVYDNLSRRNRLQSERQARAIQALVSRGGTFDPDEVRVLPAGAAPGEFEELYQAVNTTIRQEKWFWGRVHPVGFYPPDISVFGLRDVVTGPNELLQFTENASPTTNKLSPSLVDPYLDVFDWMADGSDRPGEVYTFYRDVFELLLWHNGWNDGNITDTSLAGSVSRTRIVKGRPGMAAVPATGGLGGAWHAELRSVGATSSPFTLAAGNYIFISPQSGPVSGFYRAAITSHCDPGFRCAR